MHHIEQERCAEINHTKALDQAAFDAAWDAFQNTGIDLIADSDHEQCRCLWNAIRSYLSTSANGVRDNG